MADSGASSNAELLALQRIDEAATQLQQQGNYLGALECLERGLVLRQHFFGAESDEVWRACKTVGEMCNLLAMTYLAHRQRTRTWSSASDQHIQPAIITH